MQFLQLFGALALAATTYGQSFQIAAPTSGQELIAGEAFIVQIEQPDTLGAFEPVSVVIGLENCGTTPCSTVQDNQILGDVLFAGDFSPQRHDPSQAPYENFTFNLPQTLQNGIAVLHVTEFFLEGAGPQAEILAKNVSVTIGSKSGAKFKRIGL